VVVRERPRTYLLKEVVAMTVTINKMSAGKGYEYLLRTLAAGDGDRSLSTPLTRYYTEEGTPPGRWMGSGLTSLESYLKAGDEVTEEQLRLLIGRGRHPLTGEPLDRKYRNFKKPAEGKRRHAVAGYDLTFSIPKSASVLWGVADRPVPARPPPCEPSTERGRSSTAAAASSASRPAPRQQRCSPRTWTSPARTPPSGCRAQGMRPSVSNPRGRAFTAAATGGSYSTSLRTLAVRVAAPRLQNAPNE